MYKAKAYAVQTQTSPFAPFDFHRREPYQFIWLLNAEAQRRKAAGE
jgi:hypothetical protein